MGFGDKMNEVAGGMQKSLKLSFMKVFIWFLKLLTGLLVGLTFALIGQTLLSYRTFAFIFIILVTTLIFFRISKKWTFIHIVVFDIFCILVALLLRMYILVAPGA